jgi:hypothetical protein
MRRAHRWIGAAALAAVIVGCGDEGDNAHRLAEGPKELQSAAATPAPGTHRVTCRLESDHGRVRLALDLPRGFVTGQPEPYDLGDGCSWHRPVQVPDDGNFDGDPTTPDTYESNVLVSVSHVREGKSVQDTYDEQKPDAVDGDNPEGDDSILHLTLTKDVKVFGDTVGDRLSYLCFCDGQNQILRDAQADGILLTWSADQPLQKQTDRQLEAVLASAGKLD